jgi:glycerophosphoryl diester phosphodiesterase
MSNLSNQQINQSFQGLLQVPGGVTTQLKTVFDGNGVATGLQISTTGIDATYTQQNYGNYANYVESQTMTWIAHRGGAGMAPEDTMSAFANGIALGSKIIECDVQISLDNIPVLIHDSTVDRTTNGTGAVAALNYYGYMDTLDAGSFFNAKFSSSYIPTLDEYFALCKSHNVFAVPEVKGYKTQSNIQLMLDSMNNNDCQSLTCWQSFNFSDLQYIRNLDATVSLAYLYTPTTQAQLDAAITQLSALGGPVELACSYSTVLANPSITWASSTSAANVKLTVWTVDSPYFAKQLIDLGVNRIMSNYYLGSVV